MNNLILLWKAVAEKLNLNLVENFIFVSNEGEHIKAIFLLKGFGAKNGMLVFSDYDCVKKYVQEICDKGYGFSVLEEPKSPILENLDDYIDVLEDWGWNGVGKKPDFL